MVNFYEILECTPSSTSDEIKKNYQRLIRECHPDKGAQDSEKFVLIDKAYKTLKEHSCRKEYDSSLVSSSCDDCPLIYAELKKTDIELNSEETALFPCRCGEQFVITKEHLEEDECIIECSECSNSILISN